VSEDPGRYLRHVRGYRRGGQRRGNFASGDDATFDEENKAIQEVEKATGKIIDAARTFPTKNLSKCLIDTNIKRIIRLYLPRDAFIGSCLALKQY
jgi:hypothetical protein